MNTLWKEGKVDEAIQTVQYMEKRGIVGSAAVYYDLARCLCSAGRCKEALVQVNTVYPLIIKYGTMAFLVFYLFELLGCGDCIFTAYAHK